MENIGASPFYSAFQQSGGQRMAGIPLSGENLPPEVTAALDAGPARVTGLALSGGTLLVTLAVPDSGELMLSASQTQARIAVSLFNAGVPFELAQAGGATPGIMLQPASQTGAASADPDDISAAVARSVQDSVDVKAPTITAWPIASAGAAASAEKPSQAAPAASFDAAKPGGAAAAGGASGIGAAAPSNPGSGNMGNPDAGGGDGEPPRQPGQFQLLVQARSGGQSFDATVEAQLPNGFTLLKIGTGQWLAQGLSNLAPQSKLLLAYDGPAALPKAVSVLPQIPPANPPLAPMVQPLLGSLLNPGLSNAARLSGGAFLLLTILQGGFPARLLLAGEDAMSEALPQTRADLIEALRQLEAGLEDAPSAALLDETGQRWQSVKMPDFFNMAYAFPLQLMLHREARIRDRNRSASDRNRDQRKLRFVIGAEFRNLGSTQLDGLAQDKKLDLMIRNESGLPELIQQSLAARYIDLAQACGFTGRLSFISGAAALLKWRGLDQGPRVALEA